MLEFNRETRKINAEDSSTGKVLPARSGKFGKKMFKRLKFGGNILEDIVRKEQLRRGEVKGKKRNKRTKEHLAGQLRRKIRGKTYRISPTKIHPQIEGRV